MTITPINGRHIIEPTPPESVTEAGIFIPATAKEIPMTGTVIAASEGWTAEHTGVWIPAKLKVGDVVMFGKYAGSEVNVEGKDRLLVHETDIFAVL